MYRLALLVIAACMAAQVLQGRFVPEELNATTCPANHTQSGQVFTEPSWTYYKCQWLCATYGRNIADPASARMPFWECVDQHCVRPPVFRKFLRCRRKCTIPSGTSRFDQGVCMVGCINSMDACIGECHLRPSLIEFNRCRDRCEDPVVQPLSRP